MDKWSAVQMEHMKVGGNAKCKAFFSKHGIPPSMPIKERYQTEVAEVYKSLIKAAVEGTPFNEPAPGSLSTTPKIPQTNRFTQNSNQPGGQEKKYTGMGNTPVNTRSNQGSDWTNWWSTVANTTTQLAQTAVSKINETSNELGEKISQTNWSETVSGLGDQVAQTSTTGWSALNSYWQTAKESVQQIAAEKGIIPKNENTQQQQGGERGATGKTNQRNPKVSSDDWGTDDWGDWDDESAPPQDRSKKHPSSRLQVDVDDDDGENAFSGFYPAGEGQQDDLLDFSGMEVSSKKSKSDSHDGWDNPIDDDDDDEWESWTSK